MFVFPWVFSWYRFNCRCTIYVQISTRRHLIWHFFFFQIKDLSAAPLGWMERGNNFMSPANSLSLITMRVPDTSAAISIARTSRERAWYGETISSPSEWPIKVALQGHSASITAIKEGIRNTFILPPLTLMMLVTNLLNTQNDPKKKKMTETLAHWYSCESTLRLSQQ